MTNNQRKFTPKHLKELREVNPRLTDVLFSESIEDLHEDYNFYIFKEGVPDFVAFKQVKLYTADIKIVNAIALYFAESNYPLVKDTESKYRAFRRYFLFNTDDDNIYSSCLREVAALFEQAFTNVYRVHVDEETKKIAFAFWL